jgi:FkbM family methyltransferase
VKSNARYRYYSQHGEDFLLWHLFRHKKTGFYVDVGAFDGIHLNNTLSFGQQGWRGICIEPHPSYFHLCERSRPGALCLNVACVATEDLAVSEFYAEELGLLSGLRVDKEDDVALRYQRRGLNFRGFKRLEVPVLTLNSILEKHGPSHRYIDFISIDVEGTEPDVLHGLDLEKYEVRVLVIEANTEQICQAIDSYVIAKYDYIKAKNLGPNFFYVKYSADAEILKKVVIDCYIEKTLHPLGERYTLADFITGKTIRETPRKAKNHISMKGWIKKFWRLF